MKISTFWQILDVWEQIIAIFNKFHKDLRQYNLMIFQDCRNSFVKLHFEEVAFNVYVYYKYTYHYSTISGSYNSQ